MILGFKQFFPWGAPTYFKEKILLPYVGHGNAPSHILPKIHTLRAGTRWLTGHAIHMAYGVRTKDYQQFNAHIPELQRVKDWQHVEIVDREIWVWAPRSEKYSGKRLRPDEVAALAINDGFDSMDDFWKWFDKPFQGQIIHWTNKLY